MALEIKEKEKLRNMAKRLRIDIVDTTVWAGGAHIGGGLSVIDILTILYFKYLNINPENPQWEDRDRFVLSKGHCAVAYIPVLARRGFIDIKSLETFNKFMSPYGMHPDSNRVKGCDVSTGSLGNGLIMAVGLALGAKAQNKTWKTYCILGDGECNEGAIWEGLMAAAHYKLTNLITIVDRNRLMIDGLTEEVMCLEPLADKFKAFGFNVENVDGHNFDELAEAIDKAHSNSDKPTIIIANTVKGKGIDFMENQVIWHYGCIDSKQKEKAIESINKMYNESEGAI
jgi:transketolase